MRFPVIDRGGGRWCMQWNVSENLRGFGPRRRHQSRQRSRSTSVCVCEWIQSGMQRCSCFEKQEDIILFSILFSLSSALFSSLYITTPHCTLMHWVPLIRAWYGVWVLAKSKKVTYLSSEETRLLIAYNYKWRSIIKGEIVRVAILQCWFGEKRREIQIIWDFS